jgi:hypothetical protein
MKRFSLLVSILTTLTVFPGLALAQNDEIKALFTQQIAQSGCCKARQSSQNPWAKTGKSFSQCESSNKDDGDSIYKNSGRFWWDRSC